ncbi:Gfo/Idh/MocA family protein [Aurantibacillus circumpalustris]|uniref:Gfo/Idh/MocA family protein n=1 Tax=Aurantibacillus circumpalustris TaxID=3036359 RepID=UPI00295B39A7|nr:Gfo/Idh/MocA family oxidoreductase [Aurantibacillus circumpalustris]
MRSQETCLFKALVLTDMIKSISLIGLGHIGRIHLKLLKESANWKVLGIYDKDVQLTKDLALQFGVKAFENIDELIEHSEAISILTPSSSHFEIAKKAIVAGKHVFIEKPITSTLKEAKQLQSLVNEAGVIFQVGSVEVYNPAFISAQPYLENPVFIEVHRLAQFTSRGTDVSVVLDLMMHDLELILSLVKSNVRKIQVSGSPLVSSKVDIANVRIEFENSVVANLTANRMAFKNSRKFRVFTRDNFVSINLLEKITEVIKIKDPLPNSKNLVVDPGNGLAKKEIIFEHPIILPTNAINEELHTFHNNVVSNKVTKGSIEDAIRTLELAFDIEEKLNP